MSENLSKLNKCSIMGVVLNDVAKGGMMPKTTTITEKMATPARYQCDECGLTVEAEDVRWSKKDHRALCPRCEWPLDPIKD